MKIWKFKNLNFWKFENLNFWKYNNLNFWRFENLNFWKFENLNFQKFEFLKIWKFKNLNFFIFENLKIWISSLRFQLPCSGNEEWNQIVSFFPSSCKLDSSDNRGDVKLTGETWYDLRCQNFPGKWCSR